MITQKSLMYGATQMTVCVHCFHGMHESCSNRDPGSGWSHCECSRCQDDYDDFDSGFTPSASTLTCGCRTCCMGGHDGRCARWGA